MQLGICIYLKQLRSSLLDIQYHQKFKSYNVVLIGSWCNFWSIPTWFVPQVKDGLIANTSLGLYKTYWRYPIDNWLLTPLTYEYHLGWAMKQKPFYFPFYCLVYLDSHLSRSLFNRLRELHPWIFQVSDWVKFLPFHPKKYQNAEHFYISGRSKFMFTIYNNQTSKIFLHTLSLRNSADSTNPTNSSSWNRLHLPRTWQP